jgi:hypothetical protein
MCVRKKTSAKYIIPIAGVIFSVVLNFFKLIVFVSCAILTYKRQRLVQGWNLLLAQMGYSAD